MQINSNDRIAVLGFGIEGKDVVQYLQKIGYPNITILDRKEKSELDLVGVDTSKLEFITGINYLKKGLSAYRIIFRSPGVYRYLPEVVSAEKSGSIITSNIKLFFDEFKGLTIGVTGTKGKGTTSTLIYEILKKSYKNVYLAGNIGLPPLSILDTANDKSISVLELSSFQLIDLEKSPDIAVVLNITSDHMDWHKNQQEYIDAKRNIVTHQNKSNFKVLNYDYKISQSFKILSPSQNVFFSKQSKIQGVCVLNGKIYSNFDKKVLIGKTNKLLLRGKHNWENICAAVCAAQIAGASIADIKTVVFSFKGLEHRLELVRDVKGIKFYNDSFSTNPQTTIAAVDSFSEGITLILGGYDKGLDFEEMVKHLTKTKNLKNIVLIGNVEQKLYDLLLKHGFSNSIVRMGKSDIRDIVNKCYELSKKGDVILLSPACASFDMFKNYKERGNQFKDAVNNLS